MEEHQFNDLTTLILPDLKSLGGCLNINLWVDLSDAFYRPVRFSVP